MLAKTSAWYLLSLIPLVNCGAIGCSAPREEQSKLGTPLAGDALLVFKEPTTLGDVHELFMTMEMAPVLPSGRPDMSGFTVYPADPGDNSLRPRVIAVRIPRSRYADYIADRLRGKAVVRAVYAPGEVGKLEDVFQRP